MTKLYGVSCHHLCHHLCHQLLLRWYNDTFRDVENDIMQVFVHLLELDYNNIYLFLLITLHSRHLYLDSYGRGVLVTPCRSNKRSRPGQSSYEHSFGFPCWHSG